MSTSLDDAGTATKADPASSTASSIEQAAKRASVRPGGPESLVGAVLSGRYLIERLIGEGGMGAVYQAEHTHMRKRLAVKVLHPEMSRLPEVVARFEREAMAAAHIDHPNVAAATDFGKLDDGSFFLVLEFVEGQGLRDAITSGRLELGRAIHIARQIASAVGRAHALGIVHRDLKPENVMLVFREGDPDFVKVLDFGIAKVPVGAITGGTGGAGQQLTQLGMVYGTPEYMAPEQALGQDVDPRADQYALGAMLFEMITGTRPYEHESKVTLLGMHVTAPIPSVRERCPGADVPTAVEAIVTRLLAKEASARFADARELVDTLDAAVAQLAATGRISICAPPQSLAKPPGHGGQRSKGDSAGDSTAAALGPTTFAQPASAAVVWASTRRIASMIEASLARALVGAPPWATPRRVSIAAAAGAALIVLVLYVGSSARGGSRHAGRTGSGAAPNSSVVVPPRPPDPKANDAVDSAAASVEKGDFATAIDALTALEKAGPDRADVHMLLERAHMGARNTRDAMREAALWLSADPNGAADAKLQEDVRNAALLRDARDTQDDAFSLLESKMGTRGLDILFDIAYGASGRQYPQAAARARHSLDLDEVRDRASPALAVLLDFRGAKTCESKRALLDRAGAQGDSRMLLALAPYKATRGCGFFGRADCNPCMHRDQALRSAISAIEARGP